MGYYDKGFNPSSGLVNKIGGAGKALASGFDGITKLGGIRQEADDRTAKLNLEKETKLQEERYRAANISGTKKLHPKVTLGMTDDEIHVMGKQINDIHVDPTSRKFIKVKTDPNNNIIAYYDTFENGPDGKRIIESVNIGKEKDYNAPRSGKSSTDELTDAEYAKQKNIARAKKRLKKDPKSKSAAMVLKNANLTSDVETQNYVLTKEQKLKANSKSHLNEIGFGLDEEPKIKAPKKTETTPRKYSRNTRNLVKAKEWYKNEGKKYLAGTWFASDKEIEDAYNKYGKK